MSSISDRKDDHLTLCASKPVGFRTKTTLLEEVQFVHNALPELAVSDVSLETRLLKWTLRAPIVIAGMTGGTPEAARVNRSLAQVAEQRGYAFGVGSQRAMHVSEGRDQTYAVRDVAPSALILGNIGVVQARELSTARIEELVQRIGADALCVHLNPAMELIQKGGDRDFRLGLETIKRLVNELDRPVVIKETGCGLSHDVAMRLHAIGVQHVDVSGAGGTSWVGVETMRAENAHDNQTAALGDLLWDWGIPTGVSTFWMRSAGMQTVIATGGIAHGLDVARALALGATAAGVARPALQALHDGGTDAVHALFEGVETQLRAAMLLTGSKTVFDLQKARVVLGPTLREWLKLPVDS